ncbi:MAG TPA: 2-oxoacid:ferredoxin oxidoreductase subunit gamma [Clostridia bacterium]|nr:2-oxoacid:ferredoxin oxidoreductase subunit gamma [Clostridia bacterium]
MKIGVRLAGEGGQGLILAGMILAEAAAVEEGKNTVMTQSYGPESRGGASKAEVIISDSDIDYPKVQNPDVLLVMSQEAYDKYSPDLREGGILLYDSSSVKALNPKPSVKCVGVPLTELAKKEVGRALVANIVALGSLNELSSLVSHEALTKAVLGRVPRGTEEMNLKALEVGRRAVGHCGK